MIARIKYHLLAFFRRVFTEEAKWKKAYYELDEKYQQLKVERSIYVLTPDSFDKALSDLDG